MTAAVDHAIAWSLRQADRVPGGRRLLVELSRVEVVDRSLAIGAQALLALLPLLVVVASFTPPSVGNAILVQAKDAMGLGGDVMAPARRLVVNRGEVRAETGLVGLVVALASATSFSRALQRMYAKIWDLGPAGRGNGAFRSSVVWVCGWLAYLQVVALLTRSLGALPFTWITVLAVSFAGQLAVWWWTARIMLLGRVSWSMLLPPAVLAALGLVGLARASAVFMPRYARGNVEQFGSLGIVFATASWLVLFGGVLIVTTLVGRLLAETSLWRDVAQGHGRGRLLAVTAWRRGAAR